MSRSPRAHRAWTAWALGDALAVLGFAGVITGASSPVIAVLSWAAIVVGVVLIVVGAVGDYR